MSAVYFAGMSYTYMYSLVGRCRLIPPPLTCACSWNFLDRRCFPTFSISDAWLPARSNGSKTNQSRFILHQS